MDSRAQGETRRSFLHLGRETKWYKRVGRLRVAETTDEWQLRIKLLLEDEGAFVIQKGRECNKPFCDSVHEICSMFTLALTLMLLFLRLGAYTTTWT